MNVQIDHTKALKSRTKGPIATKCSCSGCLRGNFIVFIGPPLSKKSFPVRRVTKTNSREVGIFFCFNFSIDWNVQNIYNENTFFFKKQKNSSRHFVAHAGGGQETTFYLRVASKGAVPYVVDLDIKLDKT